MRGKLNHRCTRERYEARWNKRSDRHGGFPPFCSISVARGVLSEAHYPSKTKQNAVAPALRDWQTFIANYFSLFTSGAFALSINTRNRA